MVRAACILAFCAAFPAPLAAQEGPRLSLTLAGATPAEGACRLSFLAQNALGGELSALVLEAAVFTRAGRLERLMLLDFRELPAGKPRLRQFDLPGVDCAGLGQILINGATQCAGVEETLCLRALVLESRLEEMELTG